VVDRETYTTCKWAFLVIFE